MVASRIRRHCPEPIVISMSVSATSRFIDCVRHTRDVFLFDLMYERSRVSMFRHHFSQMVQPAPRSASTATIRNWGVVRCSRSHSAAIFTDGGTWACENAISRWEDEGGAGLASSATAVIGSACRGNEAVSQTGLKLEWSKTWIVVRQFAEGELACQPKLCDVRPAPRRGFAATGGQPSRSALNRATRKSGRSVATASD